MFKSINGGATWIQASNVHDGISTLAIDPRNSQIIYAGGTGMFKSNDGGGSWSPIGNLLNVGLLVIDPVNSQTLYAVAYDFNSDTNVAFKSTDGGTNWNIIFPDVSALVIDPVHPNVICAGTYGSGVFSSIDGGSSWNPFNDGLTDLEIYALAIDPSGNLLHAGTPAGVFDIQVSAAATPTPTPTPTASPTATPTPTPTPTPAAAPSWSITGNLNTARYEHTATLLPNGKVLVAGGQSSLIPPFVALNSAELYDPATETWSSTGSLVTARAKHTATLLPSGKVLVAGGHNYNPGLISAELYDPATGAWTVTGNLNLEHVGHTATLLPNGNVLVVQGFVLPELYNPATGRWSYTGDPNEGRTYHTASLLPNGKVLVAGGGTGPDLDVTNSAQLYDPASGTWNVTGDLNTSRAFHMANSLSNGKVLVTGGFDQYQGYYSTKSAELYDPATGIWSSTGDLNTGRGYHTATTLAGGKVLVAGGSPVEGLPHITNSAELYDPATGTWSNIATLNVARYSHTATLLPNGKVLVVGGSRCDSNGCFTLNNAELYDPGTNPNSNPIDDAQTFVRQQYRDFLNREPDAAGLAFWINEITSCGSDAQCIEVKRINVSAAFFLSIEFQQSGYPVYRFYKTSFGNLPNSPVPIRLSEFLPDAQQIGRGVIVGQAGWETVLENNKQTFASQFVQRSRFASAYPASLSPAQFVDTLFANAAVVPSTIDRSAAINEFGAASTTADVAARARALRRVAENSSLAQQEFNRAFVLMQYFGYLRRNPNDAPDSNFDGYNFWLNKLNQFNGDFVQAEMVKAFMDSSEYRRRFGQ